MGRYNDIVRGPELADAYAKYQLWLAKSRAEKKTAYATVAKPAAERVKPNRDEVRLLPFATSNAAIQLITLAPTATEQVAQNAIAEVARGLANDLLIATTVAIPTGTTAMRVKGFKFAKVVCTRRTDVAGEVKASRITDIPYLRYRTNTASCPFGRDETRTNFSAAVAYIQGLPAYETAENEPGERVGFLPERSVLS